MNLAARPVCVNFDPEVLVLLEVVVNLEGEVVLTVPQEDLQQLVITHQPQLLICDVSHPLSEQVADSQQLCGLVDIVVVNEIWREEGFSVGCGLHQLGDLLEVQLETSGTQALLHCFAQLVLVSSDLVVLKGLLILEGCIGCFQQGSRVVGKGLKYANIGWRYLSHDLVLLL